MSRRVVNSDVNEGTGTLSSRFANIQRNQQALNNRGATPGVNAPVGNRRMAGVAPVRSPTLRNRFNMTSPFRGGITKRSQITRQGGFLARPNELLQRARAPMRGGGPIRGGGTTRGGGQMRGGLMIRGPMRGGPLRGRPMRGRGGFGGRGGNPNFRANSRGGYGRRGSMRGGRGRGRGGKESITKESLDRELDSYMLRDEKFGQELLDKELDEYMSNRAQDTNGLGNGEAK
eukprot:TRINITY_DN2271_c0_g1_i1.p1 TRINITY_DN2271_c0_g1~~TRINITY_DN2271_c0_g1_i1.p1  ORF type:complete len:231 (+),score=1.72 TRINITY_DN2271_c0_g1_i1:793-1485(+)